MISELGRASAVIEQAMLSLPWRMSPFLATSNQAVMSAIPYPEIPAKIGVFEEKSPVRFRRIEGMTALPARIDGAVKQP